VTRPPYTINMLSINIPAYWRVEHLWGKITLALLMWSWFLKYKRQLFSRITHTFVWGGYQWLARRKESTLALFFFKLSLPCKPDAITTCFWVCTFNLCKTKVMLYYLLFITIIVISPSMTYQQIYNKVT
jgi:hypothetical protein